MNCARMSDGIWLGSRGCALLLGWLVLAQSTTANAEEARAGSLAAQIAAASGGVLAATDEGDSGDAEKKGGSYWADHFQLHGFLSTAYVDFEPDVRTQGDDVALGFVGDAEDGTFDYRAAAIQLRYDPSPKHTLVVQLDHGKFGDSPINDATDGVELDWLFYQYHFTDATSIKVGRVPVPLGIFNEYRDVGTLLPFFRPSFNVYREGSFVSETADGFVFHHRFGEADSRWRVSVDLYYGEWDLLESGSSNNAPLVETSVNQGYGVQFWLETPVDGLRLGLGAQTYDVDETSGFNDEEANWDSWYASIDGVFEKFVARAEFKALKFPVDNLNSPLGEAEAPNFYYQLGWLPIEKLGFYVQQEFGDVEQTSPIFFRTLDFKQREDLGFSVVYSILPSLVLKGEYHEQSYDLATAIRPVFIPGGFLIDVEFTEFQSEYLMFSVSASF